MPACEDWIAYHGLSKPMEDPASYSFGGLDTHPEGIHLGSLQQANMRRHPSAFILKVRINGSRLSRSPVRVKERAQNWSSITKRHAQSGISALVYLNRWEGLTNNLWERVDQALARKGGWDAFDRMSDAAVRKLVPELEDSWIILDPDLVEVIDVLTPEQAKAELEGDAGGPEPTVAAP